MSYDIRVILDEMEKFTPQTGFNLVSIDDFGSAGEQLALIGHFDTKEEAEKEQAQYDKNRTAIYYK